MKRGMNTVRDRAGVSNLQLISNSPLSSPGLAVPWWPTRAESMSEADLVRTRPFSAVWSAMTRTLIRFVKVSWTVEVQLHLLSTHTNSYFSGQSCRT